LCWAREQAKTPKGITVAQIRATFKTRIQKAGGTLQYAEVAHEKTLLPMRGKVAGNGVVLVAAYFGGVRLIDVLQVTGPLSCG
jgi:pantothenate synthetase